MSDDDLPVAINVARPIFTQSKFDELHYNCTPDDQHLREEPCCKRLTEFVRVNSKKCLPTSFSAFLLRLFPFVGIMAKYNWRQDAVRDLIAGATVAFLHVPQAMAYGQLASLRPIHGLYVAFFPGIIYFFLGTSRQMSIGVFAVASLMVAKVLDAEIATASYGALQSTNNSNETNGNYLENSTTGFNMEDEEMKLRVEIATSYNIVIGCMQLALGVLGAGFVTDYLNEPFISGYTTACACHVMTSQLWQAIGVKGIRHSGPFKIILTYRDFFKMLPDTQWITFVIFITALGILILWRELLEPLVKRKFSIPIPIELILIIIADGISYAIDLNPSYKVPIVGPVPSDFPVPKIPQHFRINYVVDSIPIVLVSFSICISMGKMLAKKYHYSINPNQEFLAIGAGNIFASFFTCYPSSTAMSRTLVQSNVGGRTQVATLVSSALILVVILFLGSLLQPLPTCILAAVVIVNLKGMFIQFADIRRYWRLCKLDAAVWLVAFLATVLVDVDVGLYIGVAFVLVTVVIQTARIRFAIQHQVSNTELFANREKSKNLSPTSPVIVLHWSSPIYFANVEQLGDTLRSSVDDNDGQETNSEVKPKIVCVVLDLSGASFIDSTGIEFMKQIVTELGSSNVHLLLAACPKSVIEALCSDALLRDFLRTNAFISTIDAVRAHQNASFAFWKKDEKVGNGNVNPANDIMAKEPSTEAGLALLNKDDAESRV